MKYCILVEPPGLEINPWAIKAVCGTCILVVFGLYFIYILLLFEFVCLYLYFGCRVI